MIQPGDLTIRASDQDIHGTLIGHRTSTVILSGAGPGAGLEGDLQEEMIPAGTIVYGVTVRMLTKANPEPVVTFSVGTASNHTAWGSGISSDAGTTTTMENYTVENPVNFPVATDVVLFADNDNWALSTARVTVH